MALLEVAKSNLESYNEDLISKAFNYCVEKHKGMKRKSDKPFYTHPLNVSILLLKEFPIYDSETVAACLLHDTIEDVEGVNKREITELFSLQISRMVDGVTKISHEAMSKTENKASSYRKLFLALVKDVRVILIKLADRLHNIRTLHYLAANKQKDIAEETLNFYTMLAHRLGLIKIKTELENQSFYYYDRETYDSIKIELERKRKEFLQYIQSFIEIIEKSLIENQIKHTISVVHKHEYEIYNLMKEGKSLADIDVFYSLNIILDSKDVSDCYKTHGILANTFDSVRFSDYISKPKFDWYKSLNTDLIGPGGRKVEINIRTKDMEKFAEEGFTSKFSISTSRRALGYTDSEIESWGQWMQDIIEKTPENAIQIIWDSIKVNIFDAELTVYSKSGIATKLPEGASILDYAFNIDNYTGLHCISAKVNGIVRSIDFILKNGDQIELITSNKAKPEPIFQQFVVSQKAVVALYNYFKENFGLLQLQRKVDTQWINLRVIGDDREGMLQNITEAIGKNNMKEINIGSIGDTFEGLIKLQLISRDNLNQLFLKLLNVKGIKGVSIIND